MSDRAPPVSRSRDAPLAAGTRVTLEPDARFLDRDWLSGGSPWRLLRLRGTSHATLERWRRGNVVQPGEERLARTLVRQGLLRPTFDLGRDLDQLEVIVPVFNDVQSLERVLAQLRGFHVTVVDDGSVDVHGVSACATRFGATLLRLDTNQGPAHARNAGAQRSSRRLLWFIDADVVLADAQGLAAVLSSHFGDPLMAAAAPRVRGVPGRSFRDGFEARFSPLDLGERGGLVAPGGFVGYVPSACLMVRREAFDFGFDESLRVGEDVDLVWRLHDQGWLTRYDPSVHVEHPARRTWRSWWRQRQQYGASSGALARRHGHRLAPLRVDRWTFAIWLFALVGKPGVSASLCRSASERAARLHFSDADDPSKVSREVVLGNVLRSGGPLARALVRTFGVVLILATLHPRLRTRALVVFAVGTAWRWRDHRPHVADVVLGVADDLAYGVGVMEGAWRERTLVPLTPEITKPSVGWRDALGHSLSPNT